MKKIYAHVYNTKTGKHVEIGGYSMDQIEKDLKDMEKKGILTENCTVDIYSVEA